MATAAVARPPNAHRRRDAPRPTLNKRCLPAADGSTAASSNKRRKMEEPYVRSNEYILKKHRGKPASLILHIHDAYFCFQGQEGSFALDSPMKVVLEHVRDQTVPHQIIEELLNWNVPFYDGCLIVEVHNHRGRTGKDPSRHDSRAGDDTVKFSMHSYNEHITPSPMVPYPAKALAAETTDAAAGVDADHAASEKADKSRNKDGPKATTVVLHPTPLSRHHETLVLLRTPRSELRSSKKGAETGSSSSAQPPTPQTATLTGPLAPGRASADQSQKMCLEESDRYAFQAEVLLATEPPLCLEPASNPDESDRIIEMLAQHPLHQCKPPSPKTRKRTTAELVAEDAQAAEAERRMLIMDERLKPSARPGAAATAGENQSAAASLGFSRFKTLEMVRQRHEEQERLKKEEEARAASEKQENDEQIAAQAAQAQAQAQQRQAIQQQQLEMMRARQAQQRQQNQVRQNQVRQQEALRVQQLAEVQRQIMSREHGHPPQNQPMPNNQTNFQHPSSMPHSSPVVRQQTPMMNSSPMIPNNGFQMVQTSSQGAGSPQRSASATVPGRNVAMARQASQQRGSQNNTPQIPQGTPSMVQAIPNRQMSQTPRVGPGSPAGHLQGTPTSAAALPMQTPQMGNSHQQQMQFDLMQRAMQQPSQGQQISAQEFQNIQNRQQQIQMAQQQAMMQAQQAQVAHGQQPSQQAAIQQQLKQRAAMQQRAQLHKMQQMQQQLGQAGSPGQGMRTPTPQMGHAHPQATAGQQQQQQQHHPQTNPVPGQATPEQVLAAQKKAHQMAVTRELQRMAVQFGGFQNIPQSAVSTLPAPMQMLFHQQVQNMRQRQMAAHQAAARMGAAQSGQVVPGGPVNPEYMNSLRNQKILLAHMQQQQQQQQQQQGGQAAFPNGMNMNVTNAENFVGGQPVGDVLSQHFAAAQNALGNTSNMRQPRGQPQQGGQQGGGGQ